MEQASGGSSYVIASGAVALERLELLARLFWPTTEALLEARGVIVPTLGGVGLTGAPPSPPSPLPAGERGDMSAGEAWDRPLSFLDVGCGAGAVALEVAARVEGSRVFGLDVNAEVIRAARARASATGLPVRFEAGDVSTLGEEELGGFDLVYCRCLLTHLSDPDAALGHMVAALRPGGQLIVEDVQVSAVRASPEEPALDRHVKLYLAAARARGASPELGPELGDRLRRAGLTQVEARAEQPWLAGREDLTIHRETMEAIRCAVLSAGLASDEEVDGLVARLDAWAREPGVRATLPRIHQAWGVRPG